MDSMAERAQIIVKGIVQGVGFRPFIFNLAESLYLKGFVVNTSEGVYIDVEGQEVRQFIRRLGTEAPPLSQIMDISVTSLPLNGYSDFTINASMDWTPELTITLISPDVSVCGDCLHELFDPADRRYLYPFINCTNCGPRYSITRSVPYDRPNTTMSSFSMCPDCLKEYQHPGNRRFHAQPNACPVCGPEVEFRFRGLESGVKGSTGLTQAIRILQSGGIVAVKGLGGFHIACDATNDEAVRRLREKKRKSNKPFAVMVHSIEAVRELCLTSREEEDILVSNRRPIVLLIKKWKSSISDAVSPLNSYIGCMLPYTPLHYLLFQHPSCPSDKVKSSNFTALVLTSGNLSEEPIICNNEEALKKLSDIVDGFLLHNRDIFMRVDDSVTRLSSLVNQPATVSFLRRSRGYAPDPIVFSDDGPEVLACGADLKNTFTITKGKFAILSQHIGDMENYQTMGLFEESLGNMKAVYRANPRIIVHDLHPGYASTNWAIAHAARGTGQETRLYGVQHHHAHIGSVMAEYGLKSKIIGVAFDGTGYGTDANLWGGEFLIVGIEGFERVGQFKYIPLPGGESAIREPWMTAVSMVLSAVGKNQALISLERIGFLQRYGIKAFRNVMTISESSELSPLASGAGRLFDAVSALLGVCDKNTFEGEAAMALESVIVEGIDDEYPVVHKAEDGTTIIDFSPAIITLLQDLIDAVPENVISTKFHNTVASVVDGMVARASNDYGLKDVALSGGTFQNVYLLNRTVRILSSRGMRVFINHKVPCNDGGISLGQAYLVRERLKKHGS